MTRHGTLMWTLTVIRKHCRHPGNMLRGSTKHNLKTGSGTLDNRLQEPSRHVAGYLQKHAAETPGNVVGILETRCRNSRKVLTGCHSGTGEKLRKLTEGKRGREEGGEEFTFFEPSWKALLFLPPVPPPPESSKCIAGYTLIIMQDGYAVIADTQRRCRIGGKCTLCFEPWWRWTDVLAHQPNP